MADSVKLLQNCSHNVRIYWIQFAWADRYAHTNTYMYRLGERWPRACIYNVHRKANEAKHQPLLWLYCIYFYMYCKEAVNLLCLISSNVIYVYVHCLWVCVFVFICHFPPINSVFLFSIFWFPFGYFCLFRLSPATTHQPVTPFGSRQFHSFENIFFFHIYVYCVLSVCVVCIAICCLC